MELLLQSAEALLKETKNNVSLLSNASAFIKAYVPDLNWAGFYLYEQNKLILGPFQGLPACVEIDLGKGVCGTSYEKKEILNVPDVHDFDGHIACDSNSNSELVIPLFKHGKGIGVMDIDSPVLNRFDSDLQHFFEKLSEIIIDLYEI
ncbi:GAF domain-containing protein [Paracholeplasma manati]|uniref:GAF domain-containing protein n=1 Tax=Paracholeplasma manati TaxID=591373 RepID=A0ABT2Y7T8_9MOLU|nr:GAF domain-containing protein [Paracholeplasma manati]MCV2232804.1 GAF domain-containing protein [Paracholeplasma manati]MDG0888699.1 GAF domain-containing protein [Paracholeplasma manati]